MEELKGYAKGAGVLIDDLWVLSLEDELSEADKCTTIITNNGKLIAHNEDWDTNSKDTICVLKKSVKNSGEMEFWQAGKSVAGIDSICSAEEVVLSFSKRLT